MMATTSISDVELGDYHPKHYHVLAQLMSKETNLAIFRRFEDLNYIRLMGLQAEIMEAKVAFEDRCKKDLVHNPSFSKSFRELYLSRKSSAKPPPSSNHLTSGSKCQCHCRGQGEKDGQPEQTTLWQWSQLEILEHINRKLSQYNQLLIELSQVRSIRPPEKSQLEVLKNWLNRDDGGSGFLEGSEVLIWAQDDIGEYACLATGTETDIFTAWIRRIIVAMFSCFCRGKKGKGVIEESSGMRRYDDDSVNVASNIISLVIASTLPILTIFVLNSRSTTTDRLLFTILFTALFAGALGFFSSAKRVEIFAATATYASAALSCLPYKRQISNLEDRFAAVEVVFIGTALGANNDK